MFLIARTAICKKRWPSIKILWQCIQHLLLIWCYAFLIVYKNRHGLLLQYFVGVWFLKVFVSEICYKQYPEVFSQILWTMRKDGRVLLFPFFSCFSTEFFQISSSWEDQAKTYVELCQQRTWPQVSFCVWWIDSLVPVAKGSRWKKLWWQFRSSCMLQKLQNIARKFFPHKILCIRWRY